MQLEKGNDGDYRWRKVLGGGEPCHPITYASLFSPKPLYQKLGDMPVGCQIPAHAICSGNVFIGVSQFST